MSELLRDLKATDARLRLTEVKEVPGGIPGFTSFYATGTFTPIFAGSGGGGNYTLSVSLGEYTRVGNRVDVWIRCTMSAFTAAPTGNLWISPLPFTARATASAFYALAIGYRNTGLSTLATAVIPSNTTHVEFYDTAGSIVPASVLSAASFLMLGGSYAL